MQFVVAHVGRIGQVAVSFILHSKKPWDISSPVRTHAIHRVVRHETLVIAPADQIHIAVAVLKPKLKTALRLDTVCFIIHIERRSVIKTRAASDEVKSLESGDAGIAFGAALANRLSIKQKHVRITEQREVSPITECVSGGVAIFIDIIEEIVPFHAKISLASEILRSSYNAPDLCISEREHVHILVPRADCSPASGAVAVVLRHSQRERLSRDNEAPTVIVGCVSRLVDVIVSPIHVSTEPVRIQISHHIGITIDVQLKQELITEISIVTPDGVIHIVSASINPSITLGLLILLVEQHVRSIVGHVRRLGPKCIFARGYYLGQLCLGVGIIILPHVALALERIACLFGPTASDNLLPAKASLGREIRSGLFKLIHDPLPAFLRGSVAWGE